MNNPSREALVALVAEMRKMAEDFSDHNGCAPFCYMLPKWADTLAAALSAPGEGVLSEGHGAAGRDFNECAPDKETLVPCDCGCGRSCCGMCGADLGFLSHPASAKGAAVSKRCECYDCRESRRIYEDDNPAPAAAPVVDEATVERARIAYAATYNAHPENRGIEYVPQRGDNEAAFIAAWTAALTAALQQENQP